MPLDLFPADLIDKITVSKSYTVDKPGDDWLEYPGGLSFSGSGGQPLPASIPDEDLVRFSPLSGSGFTPAELEVFGETLAGDWTPKGENSAPIDQSFKASYGDTFGNLGLVLTATHESYVDNRDEERNYFNRIGGGGLLEWRAAYSKAQTDENRCESLYEERRPGFYTYSDAAQIGFMYYNDPTRTSVSTRSRRDTFRPTWPGDTGASPVGSASKTPSKTSSRSTATRPTTLRS